MRVHICKHHFAHTGMYFLLNEHICIWCFFCYGTNPIPLQPTYGFCNNQFDHWSKITKQLCYLFITAKLLLDHTILSPCSWYLHLCKWCSQCHGTMQLITVQCHSCPHVHTSWSLVLLAFTTLDKASSVWCENLIKEKIELFLEWSI